MAERLFVSRQAVSKWEADKGIPDIENLRQIAALFNISLDYLINDEAKDDDIMYSFREDRGERILRIILKAVLLLVILFMFGSINAYFYGWADNAGFDEARTDAARLYMRIAEAALAAEQFVDIKLGAKYFLTLTSFYFFQHYVNPGNRLFQIADIISVVSSLSAQGSLQAADLSIQFRLFFIHPLFQFLNDPVEVLMMHDASCSPHQAVLGLVKDVFCEMIVNLFVKKKGIHIIIYPVKGFQRICDVIFLQGYPCFLKLADIPGCCFLRKHYFILPVQAHQIILSLAENMKKFLSLWLPFLTESFLR